MRASHRTQSTTSLPRAPRDDVSARSIRYLVMMGVRVVCFILMVVITPYGWYTWVLGAAAIFLPYIAVVMANVSTRVGRDGAESPERALPAAPSAPATTTGVVRIEEKHAITGPQPDSTDSGGAAPTPSAEEHDQDDVA